MAIDWNKPIRQTNGRPARLLGTLNCDSVYSRVVAFTFDDGKEFSDTTTEKGQRRDGGEAAIENIPEVTTSYIRIYEHGENGVVNRYTSHGYVNPSSIPRTLPGPDMVLEIKMEGNKLVSCRQVE